MNLYQFIFNPYQVNTYVIAGNNGDCALVDPACCSPEEQAFLKKHITDKGLHPRWLINTHGHFDHVIGNAWACQTWDLKTAAHQDDLFLIENAYKQGEMFGYLVEQPPRPGIMLNDGDIFHVDNVRLHIYHIPGHSPGSIVLYSPDGKWVIAGDVLFNDSIGRTDLPGGDLDQLISGIEKKLFILPDDTIVHPGHGPSTTIGYEKQNNPRIKEYHYYRHR